MTQKLFTTDEIILDAVKEKHSFESHKKDITYAHHHKRLISNQRLQQQNLNTSIYDFQNP